MVKYFLELFTEKGDNRIPLEEFFERYEIKRLTNEQRQLLNTPITLQEVLEAIHKSKKGKSPGLDGFTNEYYKLFANELGTPLKDTMNEIIHVATPQTQANIILIPKENKEILEPKNFRPISLLNSDYKFLAAILAERLKKNLE